MSPWCPISRSSHCTYVNPLSDHHHPPGNNELKWVPELLYCMFLDSLYSTRWETASTTWKRISLISWLKLGSRRDALKSACADLPLIYRWLIAKLQYLQCNSFGDTAVWHKAIDMKFPFWNKWARNEFKHIGIFACHTVGWLDLRCDVRF